MARDRSSSRLVAMLNISWKLALILVLFCAQMSLIPGGGYPVEAAPAVQSINPNTIAPAPAYAPPLPSVTVNAGTVSIGGNFTITATFNSTNDTGYGPFIDLYIPRTGADGVYPGTTSANHQTGGVYDGNQYDGIFASAPVDPVHPDSPSADFTATYQGTHLTVYTQTFPNSGGGTGCVNHPLALDTSGNFLPVCGKTGDQLVTAILPFGSFTAGQPPITIEIPAYLSPLADVGSSVLAIHARSGFQFGATPTVDWCCGAHDTTIVSDASPNAPTWSKTGEVTPTVFSFTKSGAVDTATGPNYPQIYTLTVGVAAGQTVTNINITDSLPVFDGPGGRHNIYYDNHLSYTAGGTVMHEPVPGVYNSESVQLHYASVTGPSSGDAIVVRFNYYVPQFDAGSTEVVPEQTAIPTTTENNASVSGTWTPIDKRDSPQTVSGTGVGIGTNRALKVGKSSSIVVDSGPTGTSPGDVIQYTVNADVSDYFAFDTLAAQDTIADGQHFFTDATHVPQMIITENGSSSPLTFGSSDFLVTCNYSYSVPVPPLLPPECNADNPASNDGSTRVDFDISAVLQHHGMSTQVLGGLVPDGGSANDGGSNIQIVFYTQVLDHYTDQHSGTDLKQADALGDEASVTGRLLDIGTCSSGTCTASYSGNPTATDSGSAGLAVPLGGFTKSIYAVNGDPSCGGSCTAVKVNPGDTVTYRITYALFMGDFAGLTLTDYLPLPIFRSDDPDANGAIGPDWSEDTVYSIPLTGKWHLGPSDTRGRKPADPPTVSGTSGNNSVTFNFGSYDDPTNTPKVIDLLFTVSVTHDPFADNLLMTNQAEEDDYNSSPTLATINTIIQLTLGEPVLVSKKSAVSTDHTGIAPTPAIGSPIVFKQPGDTVNPPWNATTEKINSAYLSASPINSAISGVDGGDLVKFAIVVENQGSSLKGAFDLTIKDTLPSGYLLPNIGAQDINLQVYRGDGTALDFVNADGGTGLLDQGIQIVDPAPGDPAYGHGACQAHDLASGKNVVLVTYDLKVDPNVAPGQLIENLGQLTNYSGSEGGPNYLPEPQGDTADTTISKIGLAKTLVSTEIVSASNTISQAVIGEMAQYQLTMTMPEGVSPNTVITDALPAGLAFVSADDFVNSDPTHLTYTSSDPTPGTTDGHTITLNLGTVTNTDTDNTVAETLTWKYTVVVLNTPGNQANTTLTNVATVTWDTLDQNGATVHKSNGPIHASNITIIEPYISTTKRVNGSSSVMVDAGNILTFTVTLANPASTNPDASPATDAYDITWADSVPTHLNYAAGTLAYGACPAAASVSVNDALAPVLIASISHLAPGESCVLTFDASVDYAVEPGDTIPNQAITKWTSLDDSVLPHVYPRSPYDTNSTERTGASVYPSSPGSNDYGSQGTANVNISPVTPYKYLMSTSEPFTGLAGGSQRVAIGEILRYRLVVLIPQGTSTNFQVRDNLSDSTTTGVGHLTFLDDGTATVTFISTSPSTNPLPNNPLLSTGLDSIPAIPPGCDMAGNSADGTTILAHSCTLSDWNIGSSNSTTADPDAFLTKPSDVYFKLGTLQNNDDDADAEFVVIQFNALVDNDGSTALASNDLGDKIPNTFSVFVNGGLSDGSSPENVDVYVAEPVLGVSKAALIDPSKDGGDTVAYTLTISASGGNANATAFELNLNDTLDANLTPVSEVVTSTTQGGTCIGNGGGTTAFSITPALGVVTPLGSPAVSITATCLDPGSKIVVTVIAKVIDGVQVPSTILNSATVTWTSLPDDYGTSPNPTGSTLNNPALTALGYNTTPGGNEGERTGSQTPAQNDLRAPGSVSITLASPAVVKKDPSPLQYTIGQTVTYDIWVTLPEGVTKNLVVTDNIPSGLKPGGLTYGLKYVSSAVLTNDVSLPASFNGTDVTTISGVCAGSCTTGDDVTFTFHDVTTAADNQPNTNTYIIRVTLLVENVPGNQDGSAPNYPTALVNGATITYTGGSSSSSATAITVIEPRITTSKLVNGAASVTNIKAGDALTYTVRFTNDGHSEAYDVTADDILTQGVSYNVGSASCVLNNGVTTNPTNVTITGTTTLHFDSSPAGSWDIPAGGYVECTYTANVLSTMILNGSHINSVDADWFSLDNGSGRNYNDSTPYNFDGTQDTHSATFTTALPTLTKSDGGFTTGTIGDSIHYTITVGGTDAIGTLSSLVITDTLPAGVVYDGNVVITGLAYVPAAALPAPVVSSPNDGSAPVSLTWTFHDAVNGDIFKSIASATIEFSTHLADNDTTVNRTLLKTNDVTGSYLDLGGSTVTFAHATDGFTIVEPIITTTKAVTKVNGTPITPPVYGIAAGDTITYTTRFTNTGDSTADDVTADDILAQGVTYMPGSASCTLFSSSGQTLYSGVTVTGTTTLHFDGTAAGDWDIPINGYVECTYSVQAQSILILDGIHTNTVDADWTSQNGTGVHGERIYADGASPHLVDGAQDTAQASFSTDAASIVKDNNGASQVVIGQTVHITLTINVALGTLRDTSVVDVLPVGLIYVDGTQLVSSNITADASHLGHEFNYSASTNTLTWNFGDAIVTNTPSLPVVITYDAVVANIAANQDTTTLLTNNVTLNYTDVGGTPRRSISSAASHVLEPALSLAKTHTAFSMAPDAGDSVHYIVTIAPTAFSHATAYDVHFWDILPADLALDLSTGHQVKVTLNGAGFTTPTSTSGTNALTNTVDVVIDDIPITATSVVIEYWATLNNSVTPGELIDNSGYVTWTSMPGDLTVNPQERTGTGGSPNDYNTADSDSFNIHDPFFSKSVVTTSLNNDADTALVIGETITFGLNVTLPEGTTPSMRLFDDLPDGLEYVAGTMQVDATGFNGTVPPDPTVTPVPVTIGSGTDVQVDFTTPLTVTADGDPNDDTFKVTFQAVVLNIVSNQQPDTLINNATMTVYDSLGASVWSDSETKNVSLIEPVLTISKAVSDVHPGPNQVLTFTLLVQQDAANSHADAYDVSIYDDLPTTLILDLTPASFQTTLSGGAMGLVNSSHGNRLEFTVAKIPQGGSVQIKFKATVASSVALDDSITNTAFTGWTSMPGDLTVNPQERTAPGLPPNDYINSDSITLQIEKSLSKTLIDHSLDDTTLPDVAIGEILTYNVFFNVPTGLTTGVTLTDTLDTGLAFVNCVTITLTGNIATTIPAGFTGPNSVCGNPTVTPAYDAVNPSAGGRQVVFDFGDLNNSSGSVGSITVQYQVVVLDVIENNQTTPNLNNSVRLDWSAGPLSAVSQTPVDIVEPALVLNKTADVSSALPGAVITFTLTVSHEVGVSSADAYDVLLEDTIPTGLTYVPGSLAFISGIAPNSLIATPPASAPPALDDTAAPTLRVRWDFFDRLPVGISVIQFKATLDSNLRPGSSVTNMATVKWTSLPDNPGVQSLYNARSVERHYDPLNSVDAYTTSADYTINIPALPSTGFAPSVLTSLPAQEPASQYAALGDLSLEIPSLGVNIPIVGVPANATGWDLTWLGNDAGYLNGTAYPTWSGNTGITGHVYLANGQPGPFVNLHTMVWGQQIIIHMDGQQYIYEVRSVRRVIPGDLSVLSHVDTPTLTLITCQGYNQPGNNYLYRVAVRAVLIKVIPDS